MDLFNDIVTLLEDRLGFHIPSVIFWIVLIFVIFALVKRTWVHDVAPLIKTVRSISEKIDKVDKIDELEKEHSALQEESREADIQLDDKIKGMDAKLDRLAEKLDKKIERDDEVKRGELKDRIRQSYGYYHNRGYITSMELEALKGLINSYEKSGGANSFVHSVVEPEMYTWECRD